jgi:hypothetical protein
MIFVLQLTLSLPGTAALARYLSSGTTKIHFIDLVLNLFVAILMPFWTLLCRYGTILMIQVCNMISLLFISSHSLHPDIQAIADSLDNVPHFVLLHTDHNARCHNANHIIRECKNHKNEAKRSAWKLHLNLHLILPRVEAAHAAARAAEAAREAEKKAEQARAAAAAVKQQQKVDKSAAGTLWTIQKSSVSSNDNSLILYIFTNQMVFFYKNLFMGCKVKEARSQPQSCYK